MTWLGLDGWPYGIKHVVEEPKMLELLQAWSSADEDSQEEAEMKVIGYCRENETQLSYKAVISLVKDLKISSGDELFSLSRLEAYRWWYAFRKKHDLKITAKKK